MLAPSIRTRRSSRSKSPISANFITLMSQEFIATGRRKNAVARIRMSPGTGKIEVNGRPFEDYFKTTNLQNAILQPFEAVKSVNQFDVSVNAHGGGPNGQAGAVRLALARALTEANPE